MGSRIGTRGRLLDDVIWLDPIEVAAGHLTRLALPRGSRLSALGVMLLNALKLRLTLQIAGFDARFHAYDWRRSVERLADELLARIESDGVRSPMLVGHSMGGVVARVALAADRGRIARAVQLGAPNSGSFAPVLAMRGVYPTVRKLAALDLRHDAEDLARIVFRTLPSLHELLPDAGLTDAANLFDASEWPDDALRPDPELLAAGSQCATPLASERSALPARRRCAPGNGRSRGAPWPAVPLPLFRRRRRHGAARSRGDAGVEDLVCSGDPRRPAQQRPRDLRRRGPAARRYHRAVARCASRCHAQGAHRSGVHAAPGRTTQGSLAGPVARREAQAARAGGVAGVPRRRVARRASSACAAGRRPRRRAGVRSRYASAGPASWMRVRVRSCSVCFATSIRPARRPRSTSAWAARCAISRCAGCSRAGSAKCRSCPARATACSRSSSSSPDSATSTTSASESQSFVAENVVRTLAHARIQDFATVLFGTGSGIPVATAVEQQLKGIFDGLRIADHDHVVRRVTICEIDPRRFTALRRAAGPVLARLAGDDFAVVLDEAAPIADEDGGPFRQDVETQGGGSNGSRLSAGDARRAGPRHVRVPQFAADGGRQGGGTLGAVRVGRSELDATAWRCHSGRDVSVGSSPGSARRSAGCCFPRRYATDSRR